MATARATCPGRPELAIDAPSIAPARVAGEQAWLATFAPGGAKIVGAAGRPTTVVVAESGEGRYVLAAQPFRYRAVEGHTPKVVRHDFSRCNGNLLIVAGEGHEFEAIGYSRSSNWKRYRFQGGKVIEVPPAEMAGEVID